VHAIEVPAALGAMRRYEADGALWLFDRETGLTAVCDGPETAHLRRRAPRVVQFGITNACNLTCGFCSRDLAAASAWTAETAFRVLADLCAAGTLEVAFGGGEPFAFRGFAELAARLYDETALAVSVTTNGTLLTPGTLARLAPKLAQVRLSVYDDNRWQGTLAMLDAAGVRHGVNWLLTPARLARIEDDVLDLVERGARDVLLLSYNGHDRALHLAPDAWAPAARRVRSLARALAGRAQIKLDVCWGARMGGVPQARLDDGRCGAGGDFVVIGSDRTLRPCSFHEASVPFEGAEDVLAAWRSQRARFETAALRPGCAREPGFGYARTTRGKRLELAP
jgi:MoaA/NifB/PqqE/SkfB family radical SAM enzyme